MIRTRAVVLGICAAFGLIALSATGAEAEGTWLILNAKGEIKTGVELPASVGFEKDSSVLTLHTEILKIKVLFLCTEVKAVNAKIFGAGAIGKGTGEEKESKVLFSGCTTDLNGSASPECTPKDAVDGAGVIVTKFGHGLVGLHELADKTKDDVVVMSPDEGETFANISLPSGCPLGTSIPVLGKLALKDSENQALTHLVKHLFAAFNALTELWVVSKTAEHATTISGSAWAFLTGEHEGLAYAISGV